MKMDKTHFYKTGEQNDFEVTMNKILFSRLITSTDLIWPWVIVSSINSKVIAIINVFGSLALCYILLVQQKNCHLLCFPRTEQSKQNPFQILLSWLHFGACSDFYNASSSSFNIFFSFLAPFVVSFFFCCFLHFATLYGSPLGFLHLGLSACYPGSLPSSHLKTSFHDVCSSISSFSDALLSTSLVYWAFICSRLRRLHHCLWYHQHHLLFLQGYSKSRQRSKHKF